MRDILELIPASERTSFARALVKQDEVDAQQLLSDLGYINRADYDQGRVSQSQLQAAIREFRAECQLSLDDPAATNFQSLWSSISVDYDHHVEKNKLSQSELLLLKTVVGLEGELVYHQMPGTLEVCYRVAHYRFRVYSLIDSQVYPKHDLLDKHHLAFINALHQYKFNGSLAEFLNILGDQHKLSDFCLNSQFSQQGFIGSVFFFNVKDKSARAFNKLTEDKVRLTKRKDFLPGVRSPKLRTALGKVLQAPSRPFINQYVHSIENQFILRVLQVKLWVFGLYQGKLDHDFGPLSLEALKQFLQLSVEEEDDGDQDLKHVLYVINNQQCLINFQYLLEKYIIKIEQNPDDDQHTLNEYYAILDGDYARSEDEDVRTSVTHLKHNMETTLIQHTHKLAGLESPKRLYKGKKGFRKLISRIVSFFKDTAKRLVGLIRRLIDLLSKSVKFIFEEIKEAIISFKRGLSFLLGKRMIKINDRVYTDYDFDFDGHTTISPVYSVNDLSTHMAEVNLRASSVYPSIRFATEVISWGVKLATGLAWVEVLIGMARLLKKVVMDPNH